MEALGSVSSVLKAVDGNEKSTAGGHRNHSSLYKPIVAYVHNEEYINLCNQLPKVPGRASMTHSLIAAYGLLDHMKVVSPTPANPQTLNMFHLPAYLECLQTLSQSADEEKYDEEAEEFGLTYDCPAYPGVYEYARYVVGGSVTAAKCLTKGLADIAINWPGGWHHSKNDQASGFCYLNDIVIAIIALRQKYSRVLYVDLDLHHGDGVEDAFCATNKVLTVSFHKRCRGFFPGTGRVRDSGIGKGKYYAVNVPLKDGITDEAYCNIVSRVLEQVRTRFQPEAVVCQCGADGLVDDPMQSFNLTPSGLAQCVRYLKNWKLPLLLVGGGGYNAANTSRCWTLLTAEVTGQELNSEIPEHSYFTRYGPDYELHLKPGNRSNLNTEDKVCKVLKAVEENLEHIGDS